MVSSENWFGASAEFYNGAVSNSLRLDGLTHTLQRTLVNSSSGDRQKNVWSFWTKFNVAGVSPNPYFYSKGEGGGVADIIYISITSSQRLLFIGYVGDSVTHNIITKRQFRDPNAWYHIVVAVDTTQATATDRVCIYVNGVKETAFDSAPSSTNPQQNALLAMNWYQTGNAGSTVEMISDYRASPHEDYRIDGYLADFHSVDGLSFFSDTSGTANSSFNINSFGEFKHGVWIPKAYNGSHGTQGYHLKFIGTGTSQSSGAVANPTNIGDDSSGQNNHWAVNNLSSHDANIPECPENNWCTMNPLSPSQGSPVLGEGYTKVSISTLAYSYFQSSFGVKTGKWYAEYRVVTVGSTMVGIAESNMEKYYTGENNDPHLTGGTVWYVDGGSGYFDGSSVSASSFSSSTSYTNGNIIGLALDMDSGTQTIKFYKDGSLVTTQNLNTNFDEHIVFASNMYSTTAGVWNFGQDGSFAGELTSGIGTEKDENGHGAFKYAVPSGYLALCSANLPETTTSPNPDVDTQANDHFNTITYTGNGGSHALTGVGFQPDWIWIKNLGSSVDYHNVYDSTRGLKRLYPNDLNTEETGHLVTYDADGFTLNTNNSNVNASSTSYIAFNWLAGGATPTKTYKVKVVSDSTDYGHGTGSNKYQFFKSDGSTGYGTNGVDLDLQEGGTYTFDWSDSSAQGHPIRFSLTNDGTHSNGTSAGSEYTTGVTKNDSAYTTTITVASGVANLYYYCQNHSGMGAEINTNTTHGSTNFDGSGLSVTQTNSTAGFSIVRYVGNADGAGAEQTIGHGLGAKPEWILFKARDYAGMDWYNTHVGLANGVTTHVELNTNDTEHSDSDYMNAVEQTNTVFSLGYNFTTNKNGNNYVAYCFNSIEGYSKFGSFTGNASTNGTFVYTGFRPQFILAKSLATGNWHLVDEELDSNAVGYLNANTPDSYQDYNHYDILSNGFKLRDNGSETNPLNTIVIYIAFAKHPFKYSRAR